MDVPAQKAQILGDERQVVKKYRVRQARPAGLAFKGKIGIGEERANLGTKLYIGNLDARITAEDLKALFMGAGHVVSMYLVTDRDTGLSKGFAFAEMANETEARRAIALYNGHLLHDQGLIVNEARAKENQVNSAPASARPKFREIKHKRRGGGNIHRFR